MQLFLYILAPVLFFGLQDLVPSIKAKNWKHTYLYIGLSTVLLVLVVLLANGVEIPSPNEPIRKAVQFFVGPLE